MSTNKTENYGLHAWVAGDDFLREEINENFALLDVAMDQATIALSAELKKKVEVVTGTYTGDGNANQVISLGFAPLAVLSMTESGYVYYTDTFGGLALPENPVKGVGSNNGLTALAIGDQGFTVHYTPDKRVYTNASGYIYHYLALRKG